MGSELCAKAGGGTLAASAEQACVQEQPTASQHRHAGASFLIRHRSEQVSPIKHHIASLYPVKHIKKEANT
jgi:hypothetical protein